MKAIVETPFHGAPDGDVYPRWFNKGDIVEGDLANVAVKQGWAKPVSGNAARADAENKAVTGAPENKAVAGAPENKSRAAK